MSEAADEESLKAALRHAAVYGAMVVAQVRDHLRDFGGGSVSDARMEIFVNEAMCLADQAEKCSTAWAEGTDEAEDVDPLDRDDLEVAMKGE